jgi:hypothetical protein
MLRTALIFSTLFVAYDALAAILAKWIVISYDSFVVLPVVAAFFMGIYAGRKKRSWGGIAPIAIAAAVEVTAGWYVAALIGPGYVPGWTMRDLIVSATESALLMTAVGAAGVWVGLGVSGARRGMF